MNNVFSGLAFLLFLLASVSASSQVLNVEAQKGEVTILHYVFVSKGGGCTQATSKTPHPLTYHECLKLLERYGRLPWVDGREFMMGWVLRDPIIYREEAFVYVETPYGKGWIFLPKEHRTN